jgi:hypothetical protein
MEVQSVPISARQLAGQLIELSMNFNRGNANPLYVRCGWN